MIHPELKEAITQLSTQEISELMHWLESISAEKQSHQTLTPRTPGLSPGVWMSDDFDDELPDSFWLGDE